MTRDPLRDDDGIEFTLASRSIQRILWGVAMSRPPRVHQGDGVENLRGRRRCADAVQHRRQAAILLRRANVRPLTVGTDVLWVQRGGSTVRSTAFSFESDRYVATDRTVMAPHLFQGKQIVDWAFCQNPYYNIHCVTEDYALRTLHLHAGTRRMGLVVDSRRAGASATWRRSRRAMRTASISRVKRFVDGQWQHYIERSRPRAFQDVADGFFVDSGISYDNPVTIESVETGAVTVCQVSGTPPASGVEVDIRGMRLWKEGADGERGAVN